MRGIFIHMEERRAAPRHRVLKGGRIEFASVAIDCTVRNLSDGGAAVEVMSSVGILSQFVLALLQNSVRRPCHAVWRSQKKIGVVFD